MGKAENQELCLQSRGSRLLTPKATAEIEPKFSELINDKSIFMPIYADAISTTQKLNLKRYQDKTRKLSEVLSLKEALALIAKDRTVNISPVAAFVTSIEDLNAENFQVDDLVCLKNLFSDSNIVLNIEKYRETNYCEFLPVENNVLRILELYGKNLSEQSKQSITVQLDEYQKYASRGKNYVQIHCSLTRIFGETPFSRTIDYINSIEQHNFLNVYSRSGVFENWNRLQALETLLNESPDLEILTELDLNKSRDVGTKIEKIIRQETKIFNRIGIKYFIEAGKSEKTLNKTEKDFYQDYIQTRIELGIPIPESFGQTWS